MPELVPRTFSEMICGPTNLARHGYKDSNNPLCLRAAVVVTTATAVVHAGIQIVLPGCVLCYSVLLTLPEQSDMH